MSKQPKKTEKVISPGFYTIDGIPIYITVVEGNKLQYLDLGGLHELTPEMEEKLKCLETKP